MTIRYSECLATSLARWSRALCGRKRDYVMFAWIMLGITLIVGTKCRL